MAVPHYLSRADIAAQMKLASPRSLSRVKLPPADARIGHAGMTMEGWKQATIDAWLATRTPRRGRFGARGD